MAQVVEEILGKHITGGLVVTKYGHALPLQRIQLIEAGHPIPDAVGSRAVQQTRQLVSGLTSEDVVLVLISGGGSALWPAPAEGITLEEKQEVTSLLLRAGATIRETNAVRKHLSDMKGGQLARWAAPAHVVSLIISDVIGDALDFIAPARRLRTRRLSPMRLPSFRNMDFKFPQLYPSACRMERADRFPKRPSRAIRFSKTSPITSLRTISF